MPELDELLRPLVAAAGPPPPLSDIRRRVRSRRRRRWVVAAASVMILGLAAGGAVLAVTGEGSVEVRTTAPAGGGDEEVMDLPRFASTATPTGLSLDWEGPSDLALIERREPIRGYRYAFGGTGADGRRALVSLQVFGPDWRPYSPFRDPDEKVTVRGTEAALQRGEGAGMPARFTVAWTERPGLYLTVSTRGALTLREVLAFVEGLREVTPTS